MRKLRRLGIAGLTAFGIFATAAAPATADPVPNVIVGTYGNDVLIGTKHRDIILGRAGRDFLTGRAQADLLRGGPGNDVLRASTPEGHSGADIVRGGLGDGDVCYVDASDTVFGCETVILEG